MSQDSTTAAPLRTETCVDERREELEALVSEWHEGEERAFDRIVERTGSPLLGFLMSVLGDRRMAEDAWSETFLRVYRARKRYSHQQRFMVYLFTIARRCAQDQQRGRRRFYRLLRQLVEQPLPEAEQRSRPDLELMASERARKVERLLGRLPESHRTVVVLTYRHDLSSDEVGEVMGITGQQVRSQLSYARKRLKGWLEP